MKHIYFIDSENVNDAWLSLLDCTEPEDEILVFYTKKSPHMGYEGIRKLKESDREVTFIRCFEGQNALDFQLVSEVGYRLNGGSDERYIIVTNDTGYDAMVHYWKEKNYPVERMTGKRCMALGARMKSQHVQAAKSMGAAEENKLPQGSVSVDAQPKDTAGAWQSAAEAERVQKPDAPFGQQDIVASGQAVQIQDVVTESPEQGNAATGRAEQTEEAAGGSPEQGNAATERAEQTQEAAGGLPEQGNTVTERAEQTQEAAGGSLEQGNTATDRAVQPQDVAGGLPEQGNAATEQAEQTQETASAETDWPQDFAGESAWARNLAAEAERPQDVYIETENAQDSSVETISPQNLSEGTENTHGVVSAFEGSQNTDGGKESLQNAGGGNAKKAKAEKPQEMAAEAEKPQVDFDEKEVQTILSCIGRNKLEDLHNSLSMIYGEKGKDIYQIVRSPSYTIKENSWNQKEKFKRYCGVIFVHSDISKPYPKDFSEFLYTAADKRKNLNSLRAALQSKYGKEKGMKYYSTFKGHIKLMNHM